MIKIFLPSGKGKNTKQLKSIEKNNEVHRILGFEKLVCRELIRHTTLLGLK
jgi:inosine/xanthosine triphosphate pyrophosphatase family protein